MIVLEVVRRRSLLWITDGLQIVRSKRQDLQL